MIDTSKDNLIGLNFHRHAEVNLLPTISPVPQINRPVDCVYFIPDIIIVARVSDVPYGNPRMVQRQTRSTNRHFQNDTCACLLGSCLPAHSQKVGRRKRNKVRVTPSTLCTISSKFYETTGRWTRSLYTCTNLKYPIFATDPKNPKRKATSSHLWISDLRKSNQKPVRRFYPSSS